MVIHATVGILRLEDCHEFETWETYDLQTILGYRDPIRTNKITSEQISKTNHENQTKQKKIRHYS